MFRFSRQSLMVALVGAVLGGWIVGAGLVSIPSWAVWPGTGEPQTRDPGAGDADLEQPSPAVRIAAEWSESVVGVVAWESKAAPGERPSGGDRSGSGVILDQDGHVVTNEHVIHGAEVFQVVFPGGLRVPAEVVGADPDTDLAVLRLDPASRPQTLAVARFGSVEGVHVGQWAIAVGNPLGLRFERSVTIGVVSGVRSFLYGRSHEPGSLPRVFEMIQTDAPINPGNSGGALFNAKGEVIGINTIKVQMIPGQGGAVEGMGFAIPADTVLRITEELIAHGRVQRGWLGIEIEVPESLPEEAPEGIVITEVIPGGPADQAGLQTGDLLVGLDGKPVPTLVDLVRVLEAHRPQDRILVRFRRDDQEALASLVLAPLPEAPAQDSAN